MRIIQLLTMVLAMSIAPAALWAGTTDYSMTLGVGEEFNSNVNESSNPESDWISKVTAVGSISYDAARLSVSGQVNGSFNVYALGHRNDEFRGAASLNAKATVLEELLFVEANGSFQQVYRNLIRGETNPTDSTRSQVNQYVTTGKVYLTPHVADRLYVRIGYDITAYLYGDTQNTGASAYRAYTESTYAAGGTGVNNKFNHTVYLNTVYDLTPLLQVTFDANAQKQVSQVQDGGSMQAYVSGGIKWQFSENGSLTAKVGPRVARYDNGAYSLNPYVDVSISQSFNRFTAAGTLSSLYTENPSTTYPSLKKSAAASLTWNGDRLSLTGRASYSNTDGEDTTNSDQLSLGITAKYQVTPRLTVSAGGSREASLVSASSQVRWYANGGVSYDLGRDYSLEGYYRWKLADSSLPGNSNYTVNIVGLSLRKTF